MTELPGGRDVSGVASGSLAIKGVSGRQAGFNPGGEV